MTVSLNLQLRPPEYPRDLARDPLSVLCANDLVDNNVNRNTAVCLFADDTKISSSFF